MAHPFASTPHESLRMVEHALSFEASLRNRTEGLTWMVWGFVLAGIFLMYAAMGGVSSSGGMPLWAAMLWVPWVLAGAAFTWALWRTAGLRAGAHRARPSGVGVTLAWLAAIVGGFALVDLLPLPHHPENLPVVSVGLAWLAMGLGNLFRASAMGRRVVLGVGAVTTLAGAALVLLLAPPDYAAPHEALLRFAQDTLRAAVAGGVPFAWGLWQALRG